MEETMKLVVIKCLSCGASIDLNTEKKIAYCPYCGTKMLIDDEIQKIELSGKVEVSGIPTLDRLCVNADTFIEIGDYHNAEKTIEDIYKNYPNDYRGYFLALLNLIKSQSNNNYPVLNAPNYNAQGFYHAIPLMNRVCDLTNKALHFAPQEKHREIKDLACHWLQLLRSVSEDTQRKLQLYHHLENVCNDQENSVRQAISELNSELVNIHKKKNRQFTILAISIFSFFAGIILIDAHPAFVLIVLGGFINACVFITKYVITKSRIKILQNKINKTSLSINDIRTVHGHSPWPGNQGSPQDIEEALDTYFVNFNKFCDLG